ncbi:MAG: acetylornithine deacetylase/succinyl-diaminopimelate desuccinylase-like protein, partial [Cyclobacteriaceae bacterium]
MSAISYQNEHKDRFLAELMDLLRIPSVSADPAFKADVRNAAEFIKEKFSEAGADTVEIFETDGHPIVYAEK